MNKLFLLFLLWVSTLSHSQTVQLIVPFTAGGVNDRVTRVLERTLSKRLPYNFVVEYQTGAGGIIAANNLAKNQSKDTMLLIHSSAIATNTFNPNATYNLFQDFVPVARLGSVPMVLVANKQSTVSSVKQLRQSNTPLFYAAGGVGTAMHVAGELLKNAIDKDLIPVFYKGESNALANVLSNNVPMMFVSAGVVTGYTSSTQIAIIAIAGTHRNPALPDVPTFAEQGVRGFDRSPNWIVIMANPGADPAVVTKIKNALADSFNTPQDQEAYRRAGIELNLQPITNVREFLLEEVEKIRPFQSKLKQ
jgi:tripartite-type tricarboxylate transporter receptor subunit TctC